MRQAGEVIRSDVGFFPDGRPKGNGTVVFVQPDSARAAIGEYEQCFSREAELMAQKCSTALTGSETSSKFAR